MLEILTETGYFQENLEKLKKTRFRQKHHFFDRVAGWIFYMLSALGFHTTHIFVVFILFHRRPQGVDKSQKTPFWGISWPLTSLKKKFCRILKSAYRSNETFFSRTHSLGCRLEVWLGGCYRKVQGLDLIPLRVPVLIWLPDGPRGPVDGAVGQNPQ